MLNSLKNSSIYKHQYNSQKLCAIRKQREKILNENNTDKITITGEFYMVVYCFQGEIRPLRKNIKPTEKITDWALGPKLLYNNKFKGTNRNKLILFRNIGSCHYYFKLNKVDMECIAILKGFSYASPKYEKGRTLSDSFLTYETDHFIASGDATFTKSQFVVPDIVKNENTIHSLGALQYKL